jgi:hypothetical protein
MGVSTLEMILCAVLAGSDIAHDRCKCIVRCGFARQSELARCMTKLEQNFPCIVIEQLN